jgi:hypothetical protein
LKGNPLEEVEGLLLPCSQSSERTELLSAISTARLFGVLLKNWDSLVPRLDFWIFSRFGTMADTCDAVGGSAGGRLKPEIWLIWLNRGSICELLTDSGISEFRLLRMLQRRLEPELNLVLAVSIESLLFAAAAGLHTAVGLSELLDDCRLSFFRMLLLLPLCFTTARGCCFRARLFISSDDLKLKLTLFPILLRLDS